MSSSGKKPKPTKGSKKRTPGRSYVPSTAQATAVAFDDVMMHVTFADGRILAVPLLCASIVGCGLPRIEAINSASDTRQLSQVTDELLCSPFVRATLPVVAERQQRGLGDCKAYCIIDFFTCNTDWARSSAAKRVHWYEMAWSSISWTIRS